MIHYQLRCGGDHGFDGWFRDSAAFDQQVASGLATCPICGTTDVRRALMTPAVGRKGRKAPEQVAPSTDPAPSSASGSSPTTSPPTSAPAISTPGVAGGALPDQIRALLQRMRAEVEKRCDYVGPAFADEARKIHSGESERRGIYGEATEEQAESLAEEGIDVSRVPWVPRADG